MNAPDKPVLIDAVCDGKSIIVPTGTHAYFDKLRARPDVLHAYSLRDQQQLLDARTGLSLPPDVNYVWPNDPDPRKQDAAKVVVPFVEVDETGLHGGRTQIRNQARFPIDWPGPPRSLLVTWDYWMGHEWAYGYTSMGNDKQFNILKPAGASYLLACTEFRSAIPGTIGLFTLRGPSPEYGQVDTIPPPVKCFVKPETWTRIWRLLVPGATRVVNDVTYQGFDTWTWWADEQTDPVLVYEKLFFNYPPAGEVLGRFDLEYATSQNWFDIPHIKRPDPTNADICTFCGAKESYRGNHGTYDRSALVSYCRNVVMLLDQTPDSVTQLLERPI